MAFKLVVFVLDLLITWSRYISLYRDHCVVHVLDIHITQCQFLHPALSIGMCRFSASRVTQYDQLEFEYKCGVEYFWSLHATEFGNIFQQYGLNVARH